MADQNIMKAIAKWGKDKLGNIIAYKTLTRCVFDDDGNRLSDILKNKTDIVIDDALSESSTNPIQNKIITTNLKNKMEKSPQDLTYYEKNVTGNYDPVMILETESIKDYATVINKIAAETAADLSLKMDKKSDIGLNTIYFQTQDNIENPSSDPPDLIEWEEQISFKSVLEKITKAISNIRYLLKMLGNFDISNIGNGTITNALHLINENTLLESTKFIDTTNIEMTYNKNGIVEVYGFISDLGNEMSINIGTCKLKPTLNYNILPFYNHTSPYNIIGSVWIKNDGNVVLYKPSNITQGYISGMFLAK